MKTDHIYGTMRVGWLLALIPIMLGTGPLAGYFLGRALTAALHLPAYIVLIFTGLGFIAGIQETIKIIRIALREK